MADPNQPTNYNPTGQYAEDDEAMNDRVYDVDDYNLEPHQPYQQDQYGDQPQYGNQSQYGSQPQYEDQVPQRIQQNDQEQSSDPKEPQYIDNGQAPNNPQYQEQEYDSPYAYDGPMGDQAEEDYATIPDILLLNHYCAHTIPPRDSSEEARLEAEISWDPVIEWLSTHSADEVREAAQQRGESAMTALHVSCRNAPPPKVINVLLSIALETAQWQDSFGWLPIHYACACGADAEVIKSLAEAFPESKTTVDRRGRTPLHFALGNSNPDRPVLPAVVALLSSTGAAGFADDNGMLPLHYACAYGASEEALYVLTDSHSAGISKMDRLGRAPLHFVLSNAGQKAAPGAVRLLLSLRKELVNATDGGTLPLKVLAEYATNLRRSTDAQREYVLRCLELLLSFNPDPTADFFTALQALPDWLQERAVVMQSVQKLLNRKIAQRFPTGVLLSDFFVQIVVIVYYHLAAIDAIDERFNIGGGLQIADLIPLYVGGAYFFFRTFIQILALGALGAVHVWAKDPSNWLDICYSVVLICWGVLLWKDDYKMDPDSTENIRFRNAIALSVVVLWTKLLAFLRNTYIDFAVFLGGLFYVVKRLVAFVVCLTVTLIAFSQMFFTIYRGDTICRAEGYDSTLSTETEETERLTDLQCADSYNIEGVYCGRWTGFLNTFTMLLGEVDDEQFKNKESNAGFAIFLFIVFMFLMVILLANVLIAIVTDSYKVIQDQRAAIVFWTKRLDFIAEMDAIANGPWKKRLARMVGLPGADSPTKQTEATLGKELWKNLMDLYENDIDDGIFSIESICYTFLRVVTAVIIIPAWLVFGLLTFGSFWPPQVREAVFTSAVLKHSSEAEKDDELRKTQVRILEQEVQVLKDDLMQELAIDRTQVLQLKSLVAERKQEIQTEMKHIKRIVAMLFEQQSSM